MIIDCPCCGHRVTVFVDDGEPPIYSPDNLSHPGSPPSVEYIDGCDCWDAMEHLYRKTLHGIEPAIIGYEEAVLNAAEVTVH